MRDLARRDFLIAGAWSLVGGYVAAGLGCAHRVPGPADYVLGPTTLPGDDRFGLGIIDLRRGRATTVETGLEGHSVVARPGRRGTVVMFAQRPGRRSCEVDVVSGELLRVFESEPGRHFYGHGAYSTDGAHLYDTENRFEDGRGRVAIRDADTLRVVEELDAHGEGPHELYFVDGGSTIVLANGGLKTRPGHADGYGAYNREAMRSELVVIETASGKLLDRFALENPYLSIRHLSVSAGGDVAMAIQDKEKGEAFSGGPLVCVRFRDGRVVEMRDESGVYERMRHHTLSISFFEERGVLGVTSPDGGLVTFWNPATGELLEALEIHTACGLTLSPDRRWFVVTTRTGAIHFVDAASLEERRVGLDRPALEAWGSHLTSLRLPA